MTPEQKEQRRFEAACAMAQGIVSSPTMLMACHEETKEHGWTSEAGVAKASVELADALLDELAKGEAK